MFRTINCSRPCIVDFGPGHGQYLGNGTHKSLFRTNRLRLIRPGGCSAVHRFQTETTDPLEQRDESAGHGPWQPSLRRRSPPEVMFDC